MTNGFDFMAKIHRPKQRIRIAAPTETKTTPAAKPIAKAKQNGLDLK
jgi:hypothetical protein